MSTITTPRPVRTRTRAKTTTVPEIDEPEARPGAETRIVLRDVGWQAYDVLSEAIGTRSNVRLTYDGKDLEIMTRSRMHELFRELSGQFVVEVSNAFRIRRSAAGETTWKRPELSRGLEADHCYYFTAQKLDADARAQAGRSKDPADYPNPDLAIEIDISPPEVDRKSIYRALKVGEIWYFDGEDVTIEQLGDDGQYVDAAMSRFLPVKAVEIRRWLVEEDCTDQLAWSLRLRAWVNRIARTRKTAVKPRPRRRKGGS